MRIIRIASRHPLPAIGLAALVAILSIISIRAIAPGASVAQTAAVEAEPAIQPATVLDDGRFTMWDPGEYAPQGEKTTQLVPASTPQPKAEDWAQLSSLNLALSTSTQEYSQALEMPAPAGFDKAMNPFERQQALRGASVERTSFQGSSGPPPIRIGVGGGMGGGRCD